MSTLHVGVAVQRHLCFRVSEKILGACGMDFCDGEIRRVGVAKVVESGVDLATFAKSGKVPGQYHGFDGSAVFSGKDQIRSSHIDYFGLIFFFFIKGLDRFQR